MSFRMRYIFCGILVVLCLFWYFSSPPEGYTSARTRHSVAGGLVDVNSPFIFIGGIPRSGTTLMRAMLDAHPLVRCGEETRIIPRILALRAQWKKSEKEWRRLQEAGVNDNVINAAISSFIVEVIAGHGLPAERLCNKDPFTLKSTIYLSEIFPNSKFVLMIRDGRATVHSIISRKVTITGFNLNDFRQCLTKWNQGISVMYEQCNSVGPSRCIKVYYEQLVLHPEAEMKRLLNFLDIAWNSSVLHHEALIGKDITLSKTERSTDQVVKPVNLDALTKWVGKIPEDVVKDMASIAPMLQVLGYNPNDNPPNYGKPDDIVLKQTNDLHQNGEKWYKKAVEYVNDPARVDPPVKT
ncbi:sulfotransferase family domain-containing protein [Ditylenchus destructor]|nr:sulfotransferase family domain-containing protein [Ditylenchus destructor]